MGLALTMALQDLQVIHVEALQVKSLDMLNLIRRAEERLSNPSGPCFVFSSLLILPVFNNLICSSCAAGHDSLRGLRL